MADILIWGAGAIGCYLGAKLHEHQHEVRLIGGEKLAKVGPAIRIGDQSLPMPPSIARPDRTRYDAVVVTAKTSTLRGIVSAMEEAEVSAEALVFVHNGWVEPERFGRYARAPGRMSAIVFPGYELDGDRLKLTFSPRGWLVPRTSQGEAFARLLQDASVSCQAVEDFELIQMEKLLLNISLNALCAIEGISIRELIHSSVLREFQSQLYDETYTVLAAAHRLGDRTLWKGRFSAAMDKFANSEAAHRPSMVADCATQRLTEIEELNGYVIRLGDRHGLPTPLNQRLYDNFQAGRCLVSRTSLCLDLCRERGIPADGKACPPGM